MEDENFEFDIETLRGFVSPSIIADDHTLLDDLKPLDDHIHFTSNHHDNPPPSLFPDELEAHVEAILLACSQHFEEEELRQQASKRMKLDPTPRSSSTTCKRQFAPQKSKEEIAKAKLSAVPQKTLTDTSYCVRVWNQWCDHRQALYGDKIPSLEQLSTKQLATHLCNFVFEVRKKSGEEFPPKSLHHIVSGIQRHIRMSGNSSIDIYKDRDFSEFRVCLDAEMKRLQRAGYGSKTRKAEPLMEDEEEILWQKGLLGKSTPQALVDTILVMNGVYFALRSGKEHRQLRSDPCQITVHERPSTRPYLEYVEDISKNRSGGLNGRNLQPKIVQNHNNPSNSGKCFVELFKLYQRMCPPDRPKNAFYFQPLDKPTPTCWFSRKPIGHHKLEGTVARLCKEAGIPGFRTNHSLRATAATRLYNAGVDEQQVMERTDHRSLDGVRSYKHTSMSQKEALSDILNGPGNSIISSAGGPLENPQPPPFEHTSENSLTLSSGGPIINTTTAAQSFAMTYASPSTFNFHSCSVTINLNKN